MLIEYSAFILCLGEIQRVALFLPSPFLPANRGDFPHFFSPPTFAHQDWLLFSHALSSPLMESTKSKYFTLFFFFFCFLENSWNPARLVLLDYSHPRIQTFIICWLQKSGKLCRALCRTARVTQGGEWGVTMTEINLRPFPDAACEWTFPAQCSPLALSQQFLQGLGHTEMH